MVDMLRISKLTTENMEGNCITDNPHPVFAFAVKSDNTEVLLRCAVLSVNGWTIETTQQTGIIYGGEPLQPETEYEVHLSVEDNYGEKAQGAMMFSTAKMGCTWNGEWITDPQFHFTEKHISPVPMMFRKKFPVSGNVVSAKVYASAVGIYELTVNGRKAGEDYFAPGFTSYSHQLQYQCYDITEMLRKENTLTAVAAGGWAVGSYTYRRMNRLYGDRQAFLCEIVLKYENGMIERIGTGPDWQVTEEGPYRAAEFYDGEVYGLPLELNNWCIFINKQVFRDAGLDPETDYPKTWEDMVEISEKLVIRDGDILIRRGYDFRYPYYLETIVPMVEQLGGQLISDDGTEAIVGKDAWIKVLTFMQQWGPNGLNLGSPTYTNARSLFNKNNNDIAMCTTGLYQEARIRSENPEFYESGDWMVVPYPVFEDAVNDVSACHYGQYYMVNANEDPETIAMAWEFIAFMLSHGEDYLTQVNLIQPTKELMNSDTYKNMPYSDVFTNDLARAHVLYYGPNANEIQSLLRTAIEGVMLQGVTPEDAYTQLKNSVQELIDEEA